MFRILLQLAQQLVYVAGVVLAVAVDLHGHVIALLERIDVTALHGAADAHVEGQAQHLRRGRPGVRGGAVARAVVDDEHVEVRRAAPDLLHGARDDLALVEGGHDRQITAHEARFGLRPPKL